jgi:hypothetical protein
LDKTHTPREFGGLARVLAVLGLDMDFCLDFLRQRKGIFLGEQYWVGLGTAKSKVWAKVENKSKSNGKGKGEIRGSFDCVTHKVP